MFPKERSESWMQLKKSATVQQNLQQVMTDKGHDKMLDKIKSLFQSHRMHQ